MRTDLKRLIDGCAYNTYRRYRRFVEPADIRQEMWAWALGVPAKTMDELAVPVLRRRLWDVGDKYARNEKAEKSGYHADDEVFYGLRAIRGLLGDIVTETPPTQRGVNDSDSAAGRRTGATPPMEYEAALADLRGAYRRLTPEQRQVLVDEVAERETDPAEVTRALRKIQRLLGGRKPHPERGFEDGAEQAAPEAVG